MLRIGKVSLHSHIIQKEGNIISDMDGEKVMLNIEKGKYYNLGELGGDIWGLMDRKIEINEIITSLLAEYEVEQTECEQQVVSFINALYEEGLIKIVTAG